MRALGLIFAGAVLCASSAAAQTYVVSTSTAPYAPLTSPVVPQLTGTSDTGYANIPVGFNFTFFGKTYSNLTLTTDGLAYFEPNPGASAYPSNVGLPSTVLPNALLAPLWDNLKGGNTFSQLGYQLSQGSNGKVLTVEWKDWNHWSGTATYSLDFQIRLHESGLVEFHYGTFTGGGPALGATVGIENPSGTGAVTALACTPNCAHTDIAPNLLLTYGPGPNSLDLVAGRLVIDSVTEASNTLTFATRFDIQNFGTQDADLDSQTGTDRRAAYALFLSSDTVVDGSDLPLSPAQQGPLTVPAMTKVTHLATSTVAKPSAGTWYVLAQLDPANSVTETSETNNAAASSGLVSGTDLVAQAVSSNVSSSGPGEPVVNTIDFTNVGLSAAGQVGWRILLSSDSAVDAQDIVVATGTSSVAGGQNVVEQVGYNLPGNVPSGDYWFVLQLDPSGQVAEVSEANNVVFSTTQFTSRQADLVVRPPRLFDGRPPYAPAQALYFGEPYRMELDVANVGGATAQNFSVVAYLSVNDILNAVSDPQAGLKTGITLLPGASTTVIVDGVVPTTSVQGATLASGPYFFFGAAVPNGNFVEISQTNNAAKVGPLRVVEPGPDLAATSALAPSGAAPGEIIPVSRLLKNLGNRAAAPSKYRYYLTRNTTVTEQDIPLQIVQPDGTRAIEGQVTLGLDGSDLATEWVEIPASAVPAPYRIGVYMDPRNGTAHGQVLETDETNNGFAGAQVEVVSPRFQIATTDLADAVVALPYWFRLSAKDAVPPVTFSLQGALPEGISFDGDGVLQGTPTQTGVFPLAIRAEDSAGNAAEARLVFRAIPATGALTVTASRLPEPVKNARYEVWLSAQGGQSPYAWDVQSGTLPSGVALEPSGRLVGLVAAEVDQSFTFTARVIDAVGNAAAQTFVLTVVAPGSIYIQAQAFPEAQVGTEFATDLLARAPGADAPEGPLTWAVVTGAPPPGISLEPQGNVAIVRGTPARSGTFAFSVQVTDARGRVDTAELVLTVVPVAQRIISTVPQVVIRGMEVDGAFTFEGASAATFRILDGQLPPGLELASDGRVKGRIPDDAPFAAYTFTVRGMVEGGADGLLPSTIEVAERLPEVSRGCGCAGAGATPLLAFISLFLLPFLTRRRRPGQVGRSA